MIAWLTPRLYLVGGVIMAIFAGLVWHKKVVYQRDKWKQKALQERARADFQAEVVEAEAKVEKVHKARKKAADKEVKDGKVPEHLRKPRRR